MNTTARIASIHSNHLISIDKQVCHTCEQHEAAIDLIRKALHSPDLTDHLKLVTVGIAINTEEEVTEAEIETAKHLESTWD